MSKRTFATLLQITIQGPRRPRKVQILLRPCSLMAPYASVARKCCFSQVFSLQSPHLCAPRRHHYCWRQAVPLCGSAVPAKLSASGIHDTSFLSYMECDVYIRKNLHANVVWSSGTDMYQKGSVAILAQATACPVGLCVLSSPC